MSAKPFRLLSARVRDLGAFVRVDVPASDVARFRRVWPCSGLPDAGGGFTFARRNGDLVDLHGALARPDADGPALVALSQDAAAHWRAEERAQLAAGLHPSQTGARNRRIGR